MAMFPKLSPRTTSDTVSWSPTALSCVALYHVQSKTCCHSPDCYKIVQTTLLNDHKTFGTVYESGNCWSRLLACGENIGARGVVS